MLYRLSIMGLILTCFSCASLQSPVNTEPFDASCPRVIDSQTHNSLPMDSLESDTFLSSRYSLSSLTVANAYGVLDELRELETLREKRDGLDHDDRMLIEILFKEKKIDDVLDIARAELETLTDFIDCQGLQLTKIRVHLSEENSRQDNRLTKAAIVTGAISSILVAGILLSGDSKLNDGDAKDWIGVAGGIAATYLAVSSTQVNRTVLIRHEKNLIEAIWNGKNSTGIFPSSVWHLLNQNHVLDPTDTSIREEIVNTWKTSPIMLGNEDNLAHIPALLASGGTYYESMLLLRIDMLEEIEAGIDALKYALFRLNNEMNQVGISTTPSE